MAGRKVRKAKRLFPVRVEPDYRQLWRVIDGAVRDTYAMHPEYVPGGIQERTIRNSVNKRVVGSVLGYATRVVQGRPGFSPAAIVRGCADPHTGS